MYSIDLEKIPLDEFKLHSAAGYLGCPSAEILARYRQANLARVKLGLKDIEYCKRFCRKLDSDIEW